MRASEIGKFLLVLSLCILTAACKKDKTYLYGVEDVDVSGAGADKPNVKSDIEFISIAWTDIFGNTIPQSVLDDLSLCYRAFGDKRLIIDIAILNALNQSGTGIPSQATMTGDPEKFVVDTYKKFFVREPGEFEKWYLVNKIRNDANLTPELVYYAFLTSNEYRYY